MQCMLCVPSHFSCVRLCDTVDCSPPSSFVHRILQAGILEWVAIIYSRGIFPTQGSNLSLLYLPHCQVSSLPLAPPGNYNSDRKLIQESWPFFSKWKINRKYLLLLLSETIETTVEGFSKHSRVKRLGKESVKRTP